MCKTKVIFTVINFLIYLFCNYWLKPLCDYLTTPDYSGDAAGIGMGIGLGDAYMKLLIVILHIVVFIIFNIISWCKFKSFVYPAIALLAAIGTYITVGLVTEYEHDKATAAFVKNEPVFEWSGSICAPHKYPVKLLSSILVFNENDENGYTYMMSVNFTRNSQWGTPGNADLGSKLPIPYKLDITWLSWAEAKVYSGEFDLPKQKITELFREGYIDFQNKRANYSDIVIGLAPEGVVFVWVWGNMSCVEVARFQSTEKKGFTVKDISEYAEQKTLEEYCNAIVNNHSDVANYIAEHKLNDHIWDTYRERFKMRPVVEYLADGKGITDHINIRYLNGEFECLNYEYLHANSYPYVERTRMEYMEIFHSSGNEMFMTELYFDEKEIFDTYRKIYNDNPQQEVEFVIRIEPSNHIFQLALRNSSKEIVLRKTKIEAYKLEEESRQDFRVFNP